MRRFLPVLAIGFLTVAIFGLTKNPFTGPFKLQMLLVSLLVLAFYWYFSRKKETTLGQSRGFMYPLIACIVFLVAATGWFFSPFFFTLYLVGISLALMYTPVVSMAFVVTLVLLFSFNIGEVDLAYDFLVILSLLTTVPIGLLLRREYLRLKEAEKKILVLETEGKEFQGKIEEVLGNKVNNFAVNLRQPVNNIKQLAYRLKGKKTKEAFDKNSERIIASSEEALRMLKNFEEETTGKKLLSTPA